MKDIQLNVRNQLCTKIEMKCLALSENEELDYFPLSFLASPKSLQSINRVYKKIKLIPKLEAPHIDGLITHGDEPAIISLI